MQYLSFCDWLISVYCPQGASMLLRITEFPSILRLNNIPFYVYTTFSLFTHVSENLVCFQNLDIVHSAAMNTGSLICIQDPDFHFSG